jgi:putative inorganic carbon (hco3(-)) transporter
MPRAIAGERAEWWRPESADVASAADESPSPAPIPGSAVPFAALLAFTLILFLSPQAFFPELRALRPALLAAATAGVALLLDRGAAIEAPRDVKIAFVLLGWAFITAPFSYWPGGSVSTLSETFIKSVMIFWLLSVIIDTPGRLRTVATILSLLVIPIALTGVMNYWNGKYMLGAGVDRLIGYEAALTENPNDLSLTLNVLLPLSVSLLAIHKGAFTRAAIICAICVSVITVLLTYSRGGFLSLAAIGAVYLVRAIRRGHSEVALLVVVAGIIALCLAPEGYGARLATIFDTSADQTGSAQARWAEMVAATQFTMQNPVVGAGIGMDVLALNNPVDPAWHSVHNVFLQYAVDLGLPGLVLFLILLRGAFRAVKSAQTRSARTGEPSIVGGIAEALELSLVAFVVGALFAPVAYNLYFFYIGGLALAAQRISNG